MSDIDSYSIEDAEEVFLQRVIISLLSRTGDIDKLIYALDKEVTNYNSHENGLPTGDVDEMFKMRMIILEWLKDLQQGN